jgi:membrane protein
MAQATRERERQSTRARDGNGRAPDGPADLGKRSWFGVLKRTAREFKEDNLTDWAAALTYYGCWPSSRPSWRSSRSSA